MDLSSSYGFLYTKISIVSKSPFSLESSILHKITSFGETLSVLCSYVLPLLLQNSELLLWNWDSDLLFLV